MCSPGQQGRFKAGHAGHGEIVANDFCCRSSSAYLSQWPGVMPVMSLKKAMNALSLAKPRSKAL